MEVSAKRVQSILKDLHERAKELNCLYSIEDLASNDRLTLDEIFEGVIRAIPPGWQYPELCRARIVYNGKVYQSPGFIETPWVLNAPITSQGEVVGCLDVFYLEEMPLADEGVFLKEERKLINIIADRLGSCVTHRELMSLAEQTRSAGRGSRDEEETHEWTVVVELLKRTDQSLLMRIARKMINYLCWSGVKEADELLTAFGAGFRQTQQILGERNAPSLLDGASTPPALADEVFSLACHHLSDEEILACIEKWIKQDRASFLVTTLENEHTTLSEVGDAINRFLHATHGEIELADSTRRGLQVMLIKRFLTDQLEYVRVAKNYVDIRDFHQLMHRMIYPTRGHGRIGGKGSGMFLAGQIVRRHAPQEPLFGNIRTPKTWYVTSDGIHDFAHANHLEDIFTQKYKDIDEVRQEYPYIVQMFKRSYFSSDLLKGLSMALDDFGDTPLIVRSSSLLEDRYGAAFSGKYKSLFLANQGAKREKLAALCAAIAEIYASTFSPDPILYRTEKNLIDFQEGMGVMIQEVVGTRVREYYLPTFAGVAFSHNEFRWSPRIKREDGLVRIVPGLGTRAVDRTGDDYPILVSPGQPGLRVNATVHEAVRYSPKYMDVINLQKNCFETVEVADFLKHCGENLPGVEQIVSILEHGHLRLPMRGQIDFDEQDLVISFEGLLTRTPFMKQMRALLTLLEQQMGTAVDIEFACNGPDIYLLQCRAQSPAQHATPVAIPRNVAEERVLFRANRYVSNGRVPNITHIAYVDPDGYAATNSMEELVDIGRVVGKLNKLLPKHQFILIGPGRWGSRGDIKLGVRVTYSDISNTAMLIEIARRTGDYTPDLSFGTHFFQDLVEASIRYLPLYPDEPGQMLNSRFLLDAKNVLPELVPDFAHIADTVRVIDVPQSTFGDVLRIYMNAEQDEALGMLISPASIVETSEPEELSTKPPREQDWRWRLRMAERIAAQLDPVEFGVQGLYVFGSTKNATAGPASDIDLMVHFRGLPQQRTALEKWLNGWSLCLSEMNYLRTGYKTDGLLDVHWITDEDIAQKTSFALKIDAVTDAARPLRLKGEEA